MTPEQLADRLTACNDVDFDGVFAAAAAELRRLAVENEALRAESMRFRDDAMNEQAARKAIEAALAERQGEAVPFGYLLIDSAFHAEDFTRLRPEKENPTEQVIALYTGPAPAQQPLSEERLTESTALIQRCLDGFGAYIHGRKLARRDRDRLLADLQDWLPRAHGTGGEK